MNITLTANEEVTWEAASLPEGLSFRDGKISGTAKESGKIEIIAKDAAGNETKASAILTVKEGGTPVVPGSKPQQPVSPKQNPGGNGNNVVIPGSPVTPEGARGTTPVNPNESNTQQGQSVTQSPKSPPSSNADSSIRVNTLARTGVTAVQAMTLLSLLMVVSGGVMLRRSRKIS